MSVLSELLDKIFGGKKKPPPPPPPPVLTYTARVEVFDGPADRDEKIPGATVGLDVPALGIGQIQTADGAGNAHFTGLRAGRYPLTVAAPGFLTAQDAAVVPGPATQVSLARDVPPILALSTDRQIFRAGGQPWRWKGVSAFRLLDRFARGEDIDPFLEAYRGFNLLRVWPYVAWPGTGWEWPGDEAVPRFVNFCAARGFYVELTLLTDDDPGQLNRALGRIHTLAAHRLPSLLLEGGNEPMTHKRIDTPALRQALAESGYLYSSGDYEDSDRWFGTYYTNHTARTPDWPRRAHDLYEFYTGDGPEKRTHPHHVPCVADEPGKLQDVGAILTEWRAYFGACSLMGAGATVHLETGKLAQLPTDAERPLIAEALTAMNAFPADAPLGTYRRIVEPGQGLTPRTYVVGGNYMVRCQQTGTDAPEPGWTAIDREGILWRR